MTSSRIACSLILFVCTNLSSETQKRKTAFVDGDVIIGILFPVHYQPKEKTAPTRTCGDIWEQYGIQRIEATFQTIETINKDDSLLPNVTLGVEIRDSCWYAPIALEQTLEFIRDMISQTSYNLSKSENESAYTYKKSLLLKQRKNIVGIIGPASSSVVIQVQNLLQLFNVPQIGYSATSKDLSQKTKFGYFLRVVPSDYYQAQVIVDFVRAHNWTYVSAVSTKGNYGQSGMEAFVSLAEHNGICIAKEGSIENNAEEEAFRDLIGILLQDTNARVVVCFCEGMTIRGLLKATRDMNITGYFLFVGSDGWADRKDVVDKYEKEAQGSISIRIYSPYIKDFDSFFLNLNPFTNIRNPWFQEFWEHRFHCTMDANVSKQKRIRKCDGKENLRLGYRQDTKLAFIIKAIYTMAHGLHNMLAYFCRDTTGLCANLLPVDGSVLRDFLMNSSFTFMGEQIYFDASGDPPGRYEILNYQKKASGVYDYATIGTWKDGELNLEGLIQINDQNANNFVESVCAKPCKPGFYKNIHAGGKEKRCCWACVECQHDEYLANETTCVACGNGYWPSANKTKILNWGDGLSALAIVVSCIGILATLMVTAVFIHFNYTPVVKASTRELAYIILIGMLLCHLTTFPLLAYPNSINCHISRFLPGFSFSLILASLVTKTHRISRILVGNKKHIIVRRLRFMTTTAQLTITALLVTGEIIIIIITLILEPAQSIEVYPSRMRAQLICNISYVSIIAPLGFDFFLMVLCTFYAFKTRNVPGNFNEAKFIGFAMYTTCVIWVAFLPIYFNSEAKVITICFCTSLTASVILVFLYFPKVYVILVHPERNSRLNMDEYDVFSSSLNSKSVPLPTDRDGDPGVWKAIKQTLRSRSAFDVHEVARPQRTQRLLSLSEKSSCTRGLDDYTKERRSSGANRPPETRCAQTQTDPIRWLPDGPPALLLFRKPAVFEEAASVHSSDTETQSEFKKITISLGGSLPRKPRRHSS